MFCLLQERLDSNWFKLSKLHVERATPLCLSFLLPVLANFRWAIGPNHPNQQRCTTLSFLSLSKFKMINLCLPDLEAMQFHKVIHMFSEQSSLQKQYCHPFVKNTILAKSTTAPTKVKVLAGWGQLLHQSCHLEGDVHLLMGSPCSAVKLLNIQLLACSHGTRISESRNGLKKQIESLIPKFDRPVAMEVKTSACSWGRFCLVTSLVLFLSRQCLPVGFNASFLPVIFVFGWSFTLRLRSSALVALA